MMCRWFALLASGDEAAMRFQLAENPRLDARHNGFAAKLDFSSIE